MGESSCSISASNALKSLFLYVFANLFLRIFLFSVIVVLILLYNSITYAMHPLYEF